MTILGRRKSSVSKGSRISSNSSDEVQPTPMMYTVTRQNSDSILSSDIPTPVLLMKPPQISRRSSSKMEERVGELEEEVFEDFDGVHVPSPGEEEEAAGGVRSKVSDGVSDKVIDDEGSIYEDDIEIPSNVNDNDNGGIKIKEANSQVNIHTDGDSHSQLPPHDHDTYPTHIKNDSTILNDNHSIKEDNSILSNHSSSDSLNSTDPLPQQVASIRLVSGAHAVSSSSNGFSFPQSAVVGNIEDEDIGAESIESIDTNGSNGSNDINTPSPSDETSSNNSIKPPSPTHTTLIYHPKPQRLVSSNLTETPKELEDILGEDVHETSPIVVPAKSGDVEALVLGNKEKQDEHGESINNENQNIQPSGSGEGAVTTSSTAPTTTTAASSSSSHEPDRQKALTDTELALTGAKPSSSFLNPQPSSSHRRSYYPPMITTENNEHLVYYPAPIPVQLKLPPLLSKKTTGQVPDSERRRSRRLSIGQIQPIPPPKSVPNRLNENAYRGIPDDIAEFGMATRDSIFEKHNETKGTSEQQITGFYGRAQSPALSISSGFATIESDSDDYQANLLDNGDSDGDKSSSKTKNRKKKKRRSHLPFGRAKDGHDYLDDENSDYEEREFTNPDHLAFTSFNPATVADRADAILSSRTGMLPLEGLRSSSLIEELELRKQGRKTQHQLVIREAEVSQELAKRTSKLHPLDRSHAHSLLQLQEMANQDYEEHKYLHDLTRLSKHMTKNVNATDSNIVNFQRRNSQNDLTSAVQGNYVSNFTRTTSMMMTEEERDGNETLAQRRERLKMQKQLLVEPENETLAQRRARLKQVKEFAITRQSNRQPSLVL